jgi:serine/threonine-protein phosphatase 2A activator
MAIPARVVLIYLQGVKALLGVLDKVEEIAGNTPAVDNSASRFGNPAFRTFYDHVSEVLCSVLCLENTYDYFQSAPSLHVNLPGLPEGAIQEISVYFVEAWGNRSRIDYGSGMELNFLCWLYVQF